jgi:acyl-CoA thioesterase
MTVGPMHVNFNGTCHGGAVFALADSAFGLASNSHGPVAAGIDAHVAYHRPARLGERLEARAVEASRGSRVATYRVDVVRGNEPVASFTGTVYLSARPRS